MFTRNLSLLLLVAGSFRLLTAGTLDDFFLSKNSVAGGPQHDLLLADT